jgi:hypothetical protein
VRGSAVAGEGNAGGADEARCLCLRMLAMPRDLFCVVGCQIGAGKRCRGSCQKHHQNSVNTSFQSSLELDQSWGNYVKIAFIYLPTYLFVQIYIYEHHANSKKWRDESIAPKRLF